MAPRKRARRADADAAYHRVWGTDGDALPGQIDLLSGTVTGGAPTPEAEHSIAETHPDVPVFCPGCNRQQTFEHGWTALANPLPLTGMLMCGGCGFLVAVPSAAIDALRADVRRFYDALRSRPHPTPKRAPRERGAG